MSTDQMDSIPPLILRTNSFLGRSRDAAASFRWLPFLTVLAVGLLALCLLFRETLRSMFATWHSGNYSHCYLIFPIACWLVWRERKRLSRVRPAPSVVAVFVIALLSVIWVIGDSGDANLIRELSFVAMIPVMVWAILGTEIALTVWFPLSYLIFAVPMGDTLIPHLQDLTASFAVLALQASGIPALLDGRLIYLSSGTWEVAQACSGIRYLISSLVLGVLFAHLLYRSWRRKFVFLAACVAVPIVANWIRVYSILVFAHTVNRELAVGIDHVIYGWLFCSLVTIGLFSVALWWREKESPPKSPPKPEVIAEPIGNPGGSKVAAIAVLLGVLLVFALVQTWDYRIEHPKHQPEAARLSSISLPDSWKSGRLIAPLVANYRDADAQSSTAFSNAGGRVQFQAVYYSAQHPGAELISVGNGLDLSQWREISVKQRKLGALSFNECVLSGVAGRRLVWYWYWVDQRTVASSDAAKLYRAKTELLGGSRAAGAIFISTPTEPSNQTAGEDLLSDFAAKASLITFFDHLGTSK